MMPDDEPTTEQLRAVQEVREQRERDQQQVAADEAEARQHSRRADKASYLREKLEERERSEREADHT